jgi:hypothetical protein
VYMREFYRCCNSSSVCSSPSMPWAKGMRSAMPGYAPLEDIRSVGLMGLHGCRTA